MKFLVLNFLYCLPLLATLTLPNSASAQDAPEARTSRSIAPMKEAVFEQRDDRKRTITYVEADAAEASADKPVVVVWGGSREAIINALYATKELNDQGMDIGFILAPNRQTSEFQYDVEIEVFAGGGRAFDGSPMKFGGGRLDEIGENVKKHVSTAQQRFFPDE